MQLKSSHDLFTFLSRVFIMLSSPHSTEKLDRKSKKAFFFLLYEMYAYLFLIESKQNIDMYI